MSVRKAAGVFGVGRTSIEDRRRGKVAMNAKVGAETILSKEEEDSLEDILLFAARNFLAVGRVHLRDAVRRLCNDGRRIPWDPEKGPGKDWLAGFRRRHPRVAERSTRIYEANRITEDEEPRMVQFYERWAALLDEFKPEANHVHNTDETAGFQQYATLNWTLSDWNGAVTERVEMTEVQEMMGMLPSLLQAESEGQGQEGSAALQEGAAGAAELGVPPSSHRELYPAVVVREGDTAGGKTSSRPGVEGALVRDVEVPAAGGFGAFQDTNSLRSTFGSACVQQSAAAGDTGESVTATDQSIQGRSGGECGTAEGVVSTVLPCCSSGRGAQKSPELMVQQNGRRGREVAQFWRAIHLR
ncbi:unnamed protein product [Ectocarpus sp. CCAP 1310/34]|nr:unnamed protein product [Ectocarpus sp. CCAP 1310/34]